MSGEESPEMERMARALEEEEVRVTHWTEDPEEVALYEAEKKMFQQQQNGYSVLASLFGQDYVQKLLAARKKGKLAKLGDPIAAIQSVLEELKQRPEFPVVAIVNTPFWVALVEIPTNKEVFLKQTSTGNWRIGVLCGSVWASLFSNDFEELNKLEGGELYFVIVDGYKEREWQGQQTWSGNLLYAVKVTELAEKLGELGSS